ncbi:methyltransferase domain-containing protein [Dokdonella sp.]|uniref:class I SAM-dependent methyltransferase n=1 Tax=Dokdonella sp. TaxID=2291710 RepID=UPI002609D396|nr:methyltransferase domain-containing protein [Dokdonella sp.]
MSEQSRRRGANAAGTTPAAWTFFRQWLKNPRATAALAPSSRQLAQRMVAELPAGATRVIELGGGTGVFTRALLDHGITAENLLVLELNAELAALLRERFPDVRVANGDARDLVELAGQAGYGIDGGVDAVVSGLGFLAMPRPIQQGILRAILAVLGPDKPLIQFTYGPSSPLPRDLLDELDLKVRRASTIWLNVPPATVYVYTRNRSVPVRAVRATI